jgi:hypothetical protein
VRALLERFRSHALLWGTPLAIVLLNVAWLSAFGSGARLRAADLANRLESARSEHTKATAKLAEREQLWITATENRQRLATLYQDRFGTERERLTATLREVRDLATRAGLEPRAFTYPEEELSDYGLLRRSFVFSVEGDYPGLRTFLHLLELSPTFLTVDRIQVGERAGGRLGIALRLSTLFVVAPAATTPTPAAQERRP